MIHNPSRLPTSATLLFLLLIGFKIIAANPPSLTGIVLEVPTPPTPIPARDGHHNLLCELHITHLRTNS